MEAVALGGFFTGQVLGLHVRSAGLIVFALVEELVAAVGGTGEPPGVEEAQAGAGGTGQEESSQ
jgi:hypothetical protein